nr:aspergillopepsin IIa [Aspergillus aculeatus]
MKFTTILTGSLLASAALAAPLTEKRRARAEARAEARRATGLKRKSNPPLSPATNTPLQHANISQVEYSSNWAGAVLIGSGYTEVTGEFVVPSVSSPSGSSGSGGGFGGGFGSGFSSDFGGDTEYCASAWVGIDGDTCETAILQTGIDFCYEDGETYYDAWYEWYPDYAYDFDNIDISEGDSIKVTVKATSDTSGTATVENVSTGQSVTHSFSGNVEGSLCETNAEWIVEDFESGDSLVAFADFGTVTFTGAEAISNGETVTPSGATLMDIEQDGEVLTSVSVDGSTVTVTYV